MYSSIIFTAAFCYFVVSSTARITSRGLITAQATREKLPDQAFRIDFNKGTFVEAPAKIWNFSFIDSSKFPALAGVDVQSTIVKASIKRGEALFTHYHPRAAETLIAATGALKISFQFEGIGKIRVVTNIVKAGEATVFPQGLIHTIKCVSRKDCLFYATFDSADPGIVEV